MVELRAYFFFFFFYQLSLFLVKGIHICCSKVAHQWSASCFTLLACLYKYSSYPDHGDGFLPTTREYAILLLTFFFHQHRTLLLIHHPGMPRMEFFFFFNLVCCLEGGWAFCSRMFSLLTTLAFIALQALSSH